MGYSSQTAMTGAIQLLEYFRPSNGTQPPFRACTERRKAADRKKKEEDGAKRERTEEEHDV